MDVLVRPARLEDAEGLARAARDLGEQYAALEPDRFHIPERRAPVAWLRRMLAAPLPAGSIWLVAELEGEAVGDAFAELHEPVPDADIQPQLDLGRRHARLEYLAVQAEHRRLGIGGQLLQAVEAWARENCAELISTDTNLRVNVGAVEFYERHGYERQSVILRKRL